MSGFVLPDGGGDAYAWRGAEVRIEASASTGSTLDTSVGHRPSSHPTAAVRRR
ncbi:hypothetical protein EV378_2445 [Pseudonocardia endophytica]|uniref:Uncharacterized protein n=1 Tax=Pseudonocardia endophytica TaxID=401976 RepID=A0A4R1HV45_PSEEN|nr:hypothetical protein EV378_2445 [Pseudonocardia endophytica]